MLKNVKKRIFETSVFALGLLGNYEVLADKFDVYRNSSGQIVEVLFGEMQKNKISINGENFNLKYNSLTDILTQLKVFRSSCNEFNPNLTYVGCRVPIISRNEFNSCYPNGLDISFTNDEGDNLRFQLDYEGVFNMCNSRIIQDENGRWYQRPSSSCLVY